MIVLLGGHFKAESLALQQGELDLLLEGQKQQEGTKEEQSISQPEKVTKIGGEAKKATPRRRKISKGRRLYEKGRIGRRHPSNIWVNEDEGNDEECSSDSDVELMASDRLNEDDDERKAQLSSNNLKKESPRGTTDAGIRKVDSWTPNTSTQTTSPPMGTKHATTAATTATATTTTDSPFTTTTAPSTEATSSTPGTTSVSPWSSNEGFDVSIASSGGTNDSDISKVRRESVPRIPPVPPKKRSSASKSPRGAETPTATKSSDTSPRNDGGSLATPKKVPPVPPPKKGTTIGGTASVVATPILPKNELPTTSPRGSSSSTNSPGATTPNPSPRGKMPSSEPTTPRKGYSRRISDANSTPSEEDAEDLIRNGIILELSGAPYHLLFPEVDCIIIHGGLGTVAEAFKVGKPVIVTGCLLFDQR